MDRRLQGREVSGSYHNSRADTSLSFYLYGSKTSTCVVSSSFQLFKKKTPQSNKKNQNNNNNKNPTKVLLLMSIGYYEISQCHPVCKSHLPEATCLRRDLQKREIRSMLRPHPWTDKMEGVCGGVESRKVTNKQC